MLLYCGAILVFLLFSLELMILPCDSSSALQDWAASKLTQVTYFAFITSMCAVLEANGYD